MALSLTAYVQATTADAAFVTDCEATALAMVDAYISENARPSGVPAAVKDRAVLEVGADLFYRRSARNGIAGLDSPDGGAVRIARDPMRAAYDMLNPYLLPVIS